MVNDILVTFKGKPISKKNALTPMRGKDGKLQLRYGKKRDEIDRLELQVPGHLRDLMLESPDIEFFFQAIHRNFDRDSGVVLFLDILVKYRVLAQDNIAHCNGQIVIHPAEIGTEWRTDIVIHPKEKA